MKTKEKVYFRAIPTRIIWELWNRRNASKHEGKGVSVYRLIINVTRHLRILLKVIKQSLE